MTSDDKKKVLIIGAIALVLVGAAYYFLWRPSNNQNFPEGTLWICQNEGCKAEFTMTMSELGEHYKNHYGEPVPCPKCGKAQTVRAERCPQCQKVFAQARGTQVCPYCKWTDAAK